MWPFAKGAERMEKGSGRFAHSPQNTVPYKQPILFVGILKVDDSSRAKASKEKTPKRPQALPKNLLPGERRVTFLDIQIRE